MSGDEVAEVRFGQRDNQRLDVGTASAVLTALRDRFPVQFGEELARAVVGPDAVRVRKARANGNGHG